MALTKEQIEMLVRVVGITNDAELDCDACLIHLAEWSERLAQGQELEEASDAVKHHLSICPECHEEFEVLLEVLRREPKGP